MIFQFTSIVTMLSVFKDVIFVVEIASISAYVGIPLVEEAEVSISAEMSASIGINAGTRKSKTETWIAEYPSKIPRYSTYVLYNIIMRPKYVYQLTHSLS